MKWGCAIMLVLAALHLPLPAAEEPIDWNRAHSLHEKAQRGEKLTPAEQEYYQRARDARRAGEQPKGRVAEQSKWTGHLTPLTELGTSKYKDEDGGLYGGGRN